MVLLGCGAGDARAVRQARLLRRGALKQRRIKRAVLCFAAASAMAVSAAVQAVAQASYVYTTTKSKAEARSLTRVRDGGARCAPCARRL